MQSGSTKFKFSVRRSFFAQSIVGQGRRSYLDTDRPSLEVSTEFSGFFVAPAAVTATDLRTYTSRTHSTPHPLGVV